MAVLNPIKVKLTNYPEGVTEMLTLENNPEDENAGAREVPFSSELYIDADDFMEEPVKGFHLVFELFCFLQNLLGVFHIVPEALAHAFFFKFFNFFNRSGDVKVNPSNLLCFSRDPEVSNGTHRTPTHLSLLSIRIGFICNVEKKQADYPFEER